MDQRDKIYKRRPKLSPPRSIKRTPPIEAMGIIEDILERYEQTSSPSKIAKTKRKISHSADVDQVLSQLASSRISDSKKQKRKSSHSAGVDDIVSQLASSRISDSKKQKRTSADVSDLSRMLKNINISKKK